MFTMGGMWCSVVVAERGGSSSPFLGGVVDHCQRWWGGGGPSWVLVMGCVRCSWRCWWAMVMGRCWRWWWDIVGVGGVWRWPSLVLIGGGGESSPLVVLPCVAACNRCCVQSLSCHSRVFITCGCHLLSS